MGLPSTHRMDAMGTAYVDLLASDAGATLSSRPRDYGIDGSLNRIVEIRPGTFQENGFPVDFQLKTTKNFVEENGVFSFPLNVRNYNLIVERNLNAAPYYLFLVILHGQQQQWMSVTLKQLVLNASAFFWTGGGAYSENKESVTIKIPLANQLTPAKINDILLEAENRFLP